MKRILRLLAILILFSCVATSCKVAQGDQQQEPEIKTITVDSIKRTARTFVENDIKNELAVRESYKYKSSIAFLYQLNDKIYIKSTVTYTAQNKYGGYEVFEKTEYWHCEASCLGLEYEETKYPYDARKWTRCREQDYLLAQLTGTEIK